MAWANNQDSSGGKQSDYLNAADTAGRPMALPSIIFTLLFIAVIALLLFSAGRWAYNQFIQDNASVATTSEQTTSEATSTETGSGSQSSTEPGTSEQSSTSTTQGSGTGSSSSTSNNSSVTNSTTNGGATNTTPTTGAPTPESVPNTGPESLIAIFAIASIIGAIAHNRWATLKR